jgi:hypothetical protein
VLFYLRVNDTVVEVEGYQISFGGALSIQSSFLEEDAIKKQPISDTGTVTVTDTDTNVGWTRFE